MKPECKGKKISDPEIYSQTRHRDQGYRRVAHLLTLLTQAERARVIAGFSGEEVEGMLQVLEDLPEMTEKQRQKLLGEFGYTRSSPGTAPLSGPLLAGQIRAFLSGE